MSKQTITHKDWIARGRELFGPDMLDWRFVCPACGHVQTVRDFEQYADLGAKPDSATCVCIGRYDGHMDVDMGTAQPCNYTGYGLFNLCPVTVIDDDGTEIRAFAFDEPADPRSQEDPLEQLGPPMNAHNQTEEASV